MKLQLAGGGTFEVSGIREVVVKRRKFWHREDGPEGIEWVLEERDRDELLPARTETVVISNDEMTNYIRASCRKKNLHVWVCGETINVDKVRKTKRSRYRAPVTSAVPKVRFGLGAISVSKSSGASRVHIEPITRNGSGF